MEISEIGGSFKKLSKNKFFIVALIAVILMAVYTIMKQNGGAKYSNDDIQAVLSAYPSRNAQSDVEEDNQSSATAGILDSLNDMQGYLDVTFSDLKDAIADSKESLKSDMENGFQSTNGYMENGFESIKHLQEIYGNSVNDKLENLELGIGDKLTDLNGNLVDRFDFLNQSITDKTDAIMDKNQQRFDRLDWGLNNAVDRIDTSIKDMQGGLINHINNQGDRIVDKLDSNRKQENQEHSILSENINTWGERLLGRK